jgi:hypothetical protein
VRFSFVELIHVPSKKIELLEDDHGGINSECVLSGLFVMDI